MRGVWRTGAAAAPTASSMMVAAGKASALMSQSAASAGSAARAAATGSAAGAGCEGGGTSFCRLNSPFFDRATRASAQSSPAAKVRRIS